MKFLGREGVEASPTLVHGLHVASLVVIYTRPNARLFFQLWKLVNLCHLIVYVGLLYLSQEKMK